MKTDRDDQSEKEFAMAVALKATDVSMAQITTLPRGF